MPDHAHPRALRLGVCGPVGTGKSSLIATALPRAGRRPAARGRHQRHLHRRGRPVPPLRRRARPGADRRGRDRRLPAHRDPRRRHRQPDGGRGPRAAVRAARRRPGRVGRRQPHRDLLPRAGRRPDLRARRRRRRRRRPQGRPGIERADLLVVNKTDLAPYVGVDVAQMVHDAEHARAGRRCSPCPAPTAVGGRAAALGHRPARPVPRGRWCPSTPARWPRMHPTTMHTATRTEVRSSPPAGVRPRRRARRAGARAGGAAGRRPRERDGPRRCGSAAGDRGAGRHGRLRHARRPGPLGRPDRGRGRRVAWSGTASRSSSPRVPTSCGRRRSTWLAGACLRLMRETLVLGRSGEGPGSAVVADRRASRRRTGAGRGAGRRTRAGAAPGGRPGAGAEWLRDRSQSAFAPRPPLHTGADGPRSWRPAAPVARRGDPRQPDLACVSRR